MPPSIPTDPKAQFILSQVFSLTLAATTQRSDIYEDKATDEAKQEFRARLRTALMGYAVKPPATEQEHRENIAALARDVFAQSPVKAQPGAPRIGLAQKALNLWLKYLWGLGWHPEPKHGPFDRLLLTTGLMESTQKPKPKYTGAPWTKVVSMADYDKMVACCKQVADERGESLAVWELRRYQEIFQNGPR